MKEKRRERVGRGKRLRTDNKTVGRKEGRKRRSDASSIDKQDKERGGMDDQSTSQQEHLRCRQTKGVVGA